MPPSSPPKITHPFDSECRIACQKRKDGNDVEQLGSRVPENQTGNQESEKMAVIQSFFSDSGFQDKISRDNSDRRHQSVRMKRERTDGKQIIIHIYGSFSI